MFKLWSNKGLSSWCPVFLQGSKNNFFPFFKFVIQRGESMCYFLCTLTDLPSHISVQIPVVLKNSCSYWTFKLSRETQHCPPPWQVRDSMNNTVYKLFWNKSCFVGWVTGFMANALWYLYLGAERCLKKLCFKLHCIHIFGNKRVYFLILFVFVYFSFPLWFINPLF